MKRAVHVLRRLNPGGVECWLLDLVRRGGVPGFQTEVLLETEGPGSLEREFVAAGVRIRRWRLGDFAALASILRGAEVVHSHVHAFSGAILTVARLMRVPVRIAHSHCMERGRWWMRSLLKANVTHRLAVSLPAAFALFGEGVPFAFVPCARDFDAWPVRKKLCQGDEIFIGHVGRAVPEKNHRFLFDLLKLDSRFRLLLASDCGEWRDRRVEFVANSADVYRRADCFVFPSMKEGLGLALVEAQAAGLSCVVSDCVPHEAVVDSRLVQRLSLLDVPEVWRKAIVSAARAVVHPDGSVLRSPFHITENIRSLTEVYASR